MLFAILWMTREVGTIYPGNTRAERSVYSMSSPQIKNSVIGKPIFATISRLNITDTKVAFRSGPSSVACNEILWKRFLGDGKFINARELSVQRTSEAKKPNWLLIFLAALTNSVRAVGVGTVSSSINQT